MIRTESHFETRENSEGRRRRVWSTCFLKLCSGAGCTATVGALLVARALLLASPPAFGAESEVAGIPWTGAPGITETVDQIMAREALVPRVPRTGLRDVRPEREPEQEKQADPLAPEISRWPPPEGVGVAVESLLSPQTPGVNFLAITSTNPPGESLFIPPDSMGDVGPTQILTVANGRIKVFDKTGAPGPLNADTAVFFGSVNAPCTVSNGLLVCMSDPHIRYDRLSGRWFVVMLDTDSPGRIMIAVSSGPVITGTTSFTFFQFRHDLGGDAGSSPDYPTLGVDRFALYIGLTEFGTTTTDTKAFVVNKANLLSGSLTVTTFRHLLDGSGGSSSASDGPASPQGVDNDDPQSTNGYIAGDSFAFHSRLVLRRVSNPGGTPAMSTNILLTVPTTCAPIDQPALASQPLDAVDERLFAAEIHRNKITGAVTLWTAHNISVNLTGACTNAQAGGDRNASRWYQIGNLDTAPSLVQSGTLFDPTPAGPSSPRGFWMDSVAGSGQGHMALGCSFASPAEFAGVAVAGRLRTDTLGSTQAATIALPGVDFYNEPDSTGRNRWGDYSQTVVDPNDDMTMWTFQEYANTRGTFDPGIPSPGDWGVRVVQLLAPPPATPSAVGTISPSFGVPGFVPRGAASATVPVTGTSISGSEFFDPGPDTGGPGYANHIGASVSGGVTLNSPASFTDPTHVSLNISTVAATCSTKDITVTNPDGQSRTGTALLTDIPPAPAASNSGPICSGQTLSLMAGTSPVTGATVTYAWTGPNGFTSTQQNPMIANAPAAASGTYSATVSVGGCASPPGTTNAVVNQTPSTTASNGGPICEGAALQLTASTVAGGTYAWAGPNGFTSTQQNPSIPNATTAASGAYTVTVTANGCTSTPATTTATVIANGTACGDGDPCTTNDVCSGGSCAGQPVVCTASDQCHVAGTCDPKSGVCSNPNAPDGTACTDNNACTGDDACSGGTCVGLVLTCDDGNACTSNDCNPSSGCVNTPLPDGTLCNDHRSCTTNDACSSGTCVGTPIVPAEVMHLLFTDRTTLVWDSAGGSGTSTVYDVARGLANELPVGSGASEVCFASGLAAATTTDTARPAAGKSFWYLPRGRNACATGTYGFASDGTPRVTSVCP